MPGNVIAVVTTLDTKGREARFLADWFRDRGYEPRLVDVGVPSSRWSARREEAMTASAREAGVILRGWHLNGVLGGVIGLGGNQGTAAASIAMRDLPIGLPKVVVSTVASGNLRPYIGASDIAIVPALGDLLGGPNILTRGVLERAAGMLSGMIQATRPGAEGERLQPMPGKGPAARGPLVAVTALGTTQPAALRIVERLQREGYEVVPFHASGCGGSVMEGMVDAGQTAGVVDLTTHELLGEVLGEDIYAPVSPGRLTAAGRGGLPQVVAPGGLDYFVFGPRESMPLRFRARRSHQHNPYNTKVRVTADEMRKVGEVLAQRLNAATGPTAFLYPLKGWSEIGTIGGPLADLEANEALRMVVRDLLRSDRVRYQELDTDINDPRFADEIVHVFLELMAARRGALRA